MSDCSSFKKQKHFVISAFPLNFQWTNRKEVAVVYRLFMTFYTMGWLAADLVLNEDPYYYIYLTHWSQFVSCSYFGKYRMVSEQQQQIKK